MSNTNPTKNRRWIQVISKGKQFLLLIWHRRVCHMVKSGEILYTTDVFVTWSNLVKSYMPPTCLSHGHVWWNLIWHRRVCHMIKSGEILYDTVVFVTWSSLVKALSVIEERIDMICTRLLSFWSLYSLSFELWSLNTPLLSPNFS